MSVTTDKYNYTFIHNVFGSFIEDTLDYFADYLYPRFAHQVVGTYDKAVEYLTKTAQYARETDKPNLPAIILNPSGEFNLDEANTTARQLWRFPNLAPGIAANMYLPIYQDKHVKVVVAFTRLKGEIELLMLLNSFYEYFDVKLFLLQIFGGEGRPIKPTQFDSFIILPSELYNYQYSNDVTGLTYTLDWESAGAYSYLVKTTNQTEQVVAGSITPEYTLRGLADASTRHGGIDSLADWRLTAQIEYTIEIPSYIILETDYLVENINFNFRYGSCYTKYEDYNVPVNVNTVVTSWDSGLSDSEHGILDLPDSATVDSTSWTDIVFKTRYFHEVTQDESDSTSNIIISLPETISDQRLIKLQSHSGLMSYGDHYILQNDGDEIAIIIDNVEINAGEFIEIYVYKEV